MAVRIAQISDTHLSDAKPYFVANFEHTATELRDRKPDLVVNTGDLSLNGADLDADLAGARARHEAVGLRWRAIAGNHDVGDCREVAKTQAVDPARLARWRRLIGDSWWSEDVPGWRILAIDALLLGSGLTEDAAQTDFIRSRTARLGGRALMLLIHKPLFDRAPTETDSDGMFVTLGPRRQLYAALGGVAPRVVASGHVHQWRETTHSGTTHVWAPGVSFVTPPWLLPEYGVRTVGFVEHRLEPDGRCAARLVGVSRTVNHDLIDFPEAYGDLAKVRAARAAIPAAAS